MSKKATIIAVVNQKGGTDIDDLALPVMELKARDRVRLVFSFYDD